VSVGSRADGATDELHYVFSVVSCLSLPSMGIGRESGYVFVDGAGFADGSSRDLTSSPCKLEDGTTPATAPAVATDVFRDSRLVFSRTGASILDADVEIDRHALASPSV
jgi:hypothetical protein